jgi:hypothetical protein
MRTLFRHAGLDPASTFFCPAAVREEGGSRVEPGMTVVF